MRISDWSSDVCSSDLTPLFFRFKSKGVINTTTLNITNNISLKNIFSYRKFDISRGFDLDGTTLQILDVINPFKGYTKLRTEEVQLRADFDRVRGVIGYYDEKLNEPYALASQTVQYIRSEEHTSELQSLMRISYAVFCLKTQNNTTHLHNQ